MDFRGSGIHQHGLFYNLLFQHDTEHVAFSGGGAPVSGSCDCNADVDTAIRRKNQRTKVHIMCARVRGLCFDGRHYRKRHGDTDDFTSHRCVVRVWICALQYLRSDFHKPRIRSYDDDDIYVSFCNGRRFSSTKTR